MNKNITPAAMLASISAEMDLDRRTIIFHVIDAAGIDTGADKPIAAGSVLDADRLELSDAFLDLAGEYDSTPALYIPNVTTYMIGTAGDAYSANGTDIDIMSRYRDSAPEVFYSMLDEYAEILATVDDITVPNPYYEEENV